MTNEERRHSRSITVVLEYVFKSRVSALMLRFSCHVALWLVSPNSSLNAAVHIAQKSDLEMTSQPKKVGKQDGEAIPAPARRKPLLDQHEKHGRPSALFVVYTLGSHFNIQLRGG